MKKKTALFIAGVIVLVAGITAYASRRRKAVERSAKVAEEGYETAADILYPNKR